MNNFAVTALDKVTEGTYGYTLRLDTNNIKAYSIEFIQAYAVIAAASSAPSEGSVSLKTLNSYLEDENCPDLAFNYTYGICTIFLKTSAYPYTSDSKITLFGKRNGLKMNYMIEKADFPDEYIELFSAYVIKIASLLRGKPIPADVSRIIMREEYAIKNAG